MPVLATLAAINLVFGSSSNEAVSFLNPYKLRARCKEEIENVHKQAQAIALTEELERLAAQYQKSVVITLEAYIEESVKWESSADGLIDVLEHWDRSRDNTLREIVRVRQAMHDLLTAEQWARIFS